MLLLHEVREEGHQCQARLGCIVRPMYVYLYVFIKLKQKTPSEPCGWKNVSPQHPGSGGSRFEVSLGYTVSLRATWLHESLFNEREPLPGKPEEMEEPGPRRVSGGVSEPRTPFPIIVKAADLRHRVSIYR